MSPSQILLSLALAPALMFAQPQLQFPTLPSYPPVNIARVLSLSGGTSFVGTNSLGMALRSGRGSTKLGGSGIDTPLDALVDVSGNIWITGTTTSADFPLLNPIVPKIVPGVEAGFVMELSPGGALLFATYLAGQSQCLCGTTATALTADVAGNIYVGGATSESDFPVTPGAFLTTGPSSGAFANVYTFSYVVKISPAGKLIYGTFLGTGDQSCVGGSSCIGAQSKSATVDTLAADSSGAVTASESMSIGPGRVSRIAPDGSRLLWTTDTGKPSGGIDRLLLAQDSSGNVFLFGQFAPLPPQSPPQFGTGTPSLFTQKLSSTGALVYSVDLGSQSPDAHPVGILLDTSGNVWLAGTDSSTAAPLSGTAGIGADFVLQLNSATLLRFPRGVIAASPVFDAKGNLLIPGANGTLLTLPAGYSGSTPAIVSIANAASFAMNTGIYPGALISIFGIGLGNGPVTVIWGSVAAKVLYSGPNQINLQVPFETPPAANYLAQIVLPSGTILQPLSGTSRSIGIFTADGTYAAALNQDGTVNSASNPATSGSIVTLYGTGAIWPSGTPDGGIPVSAAPLNQEQNGFQIVDRLGVPGTVLYAGAAPQIIDGVFQTNVLIPVGAQAPFTVESITAGPTVLSSNPVMVYMK